ncbi:uncharacterized protein LOC119644300 [Glossina fuscipes]|uniref:Uncharacterized protein LOC119644300 n=1 Tax=Glossina fuscipes TaxID=7396 RepID=A0A9C5ZJ53_9MUSC|nr:uncharacterized protein LOC119644300 [Glossina fuscipes]KAI9575141.1 hypothetical protein GQX74_015281 [Glossina fuscipes]
MDSPVKNTEGKKRKELEDEEKITKRVKEELPSTSSPIIDNKVKGGKIEDENLPIPEKQYAELQHEATDISRNKSRKFPKTKKFLSRIYRANHFKERDIGESFVEQYEVRHAQIRGIYLMYFMRKHLATMYNAKLKDFRVEEVFKKKYSENEKEFRIQKQMPESYKIYIDNKCQTMHSVEKIKIVSLAHTMYYADKSEGRPSPSVEIRVADGNLEAILKYLETFKSKYKSVDINPRLDCDYFRGDANVIFDDEVIFQTMSSLKENNMPVDKAHQCILYSLAYFKKTRKKILKFIVYNPLAGKEFIMQLEDIDLEGLEDALKSDLMIEEDEGKIEKKNEDK